MKLCLGLYAVVLAVTLVKGEALASGEDANGKIVGGVLVPMGGAPFQVSFQIIDGADRYHFCGGSIIDPNFIITAAHCCKAASSYSLQILAGLNKLSNPEDGFQKISVTDAIIHPVYDPATNQADICILRLKQPLVLSSERRTAMIKLPPAGYMASGLANVTGWGDDGTRTDDLMRVQVPIVPDNACRQSYPTVTDDMICAGEKGKDSCQGDSGGPLVDSEGFIVGIVSWGKGCGEAGYPGVYTEVSYFTQWVQTVLSNSRGTQ